MNSGRISAHAATPIPQIRLYRDWLKQTRGLDFATYDDLHSWSVDDIEGFWRSIWDWEGIASPTRATGVLSGDDMPGARWFEGATVNYARHVFSHAEAAEAAGQPAIVAMDERGGSETIGWAELRRRAASLALELRERGIEPGDRVAGYLPNIPAAVVGLLACAGIGAVWTLCSPDMGTNAVLDRWRQTQPKALIAVDGVFYAGKSMDRSAAIAEIRSRLPSVETLFVVASGCNDRDLPDAIDFAAATARDDKAVAAFEPAWLPFDHPLWILYSSGTTGLPKAIVHGHGGVILATAAGRLHFDLGPSYDANTLGDRFHWYSASGWVMWNIQVGGLLSGTTICLFDGSPSGTKADPDWARLWDFAARSGVTWFGAGAAFFANCRKAGVEVARIEGVERIRALGSTGSPLPPDVQRWGTAQFAALGRPDIWWCNVSGGTEIAAAFMAGNPELPDTPGRLQCRHLGAAIEAWDEHGEPVIDEVGELVCTKPFPSMPLHFWGDDGSRYRESYFAEWPGIWRHGDWLTVHSDGSCTISGRSDATINRHGVRMGTAEIYAAVERLPEIADTMIVDVENGEGDSELIMFVVPSEGRRVDADTRAAVAAAIRSSLSPRFVPDRFIEAPGIPRTLSGKKQELPIKRLFAGWPVAKVINADASATPELLPWYIDQAQVWQGDERGGADMRAEQTS
ncbi:MAG: acetoacetate--CoA ligase [Pseudomonadota bacterium]|nr:acetoacetate--CoA ligase [Pseudomonadota bacterium]